MVCEGGWACQPAGRSRVMAAESAAERLLSAETLRLTASLALAGRMRLPGSTEMEKGGAMARDTSLGPTAVAVTIPSPPSRAYAAEAVTGQGASGRVAEAGVSMV